MPPFLICLIPGSKARSNLVSKGSKYLLPQHHLYVSITKIWRQQNTDSVHEKNQTQPDGYTSSSK
ncbi:hypothetical protein COPCOM_03623 [Coprococcus comes ATCC 27758]|uniref:Uncharacterized protein n=1 Tax=Coprococcus comes ATCC 27758 TaxID=470146 RepID=C0BEL1_9FIRM|nr:hypothetical protein COPCOM_03623 [Coprococcus comes ATCC 27758]